jgi:hypothetical protein
MSSGPRPRGPITRQPATLPGKPVGPVLGFTGRARAGKDTAARWWVERHGFVRLGFADGLVAEVRRMLPRTLLALAHQAFDTGQLGGQWTTDSNMVSVLLALKPAPLRALLQEWGTDLRRASDPDYWIDTWRAAWAERGFPAVVVPDVRFLNEAAALQAHGGHVLRVERAGIDLPAGLATHASETEMAGVRVAGTLVNAGTLADLHVQCAAWWASQEILWSSPSPVS